MKSKLLLPFAGLVVLAAGLGLWWWQRAPAPGSTTPAVVARRHPAKIPSVVLVNDSRDAVVPMEAPVFVELVVTNPTDEPIDVAFDRLGLEIRGAAGDRPAVRWEALAAPAPRIPIGGSVGLRWVAATALPAGTYTIQATGLTEASSATVRLAVEPGRLRVSDERDADALLAAEIQLRAWRGDTAGALADIERALASVPDALVLQLWRADLLRALGREADAQQQWRALGDMIDQRQRQSPRGAPEFPFWLAERLAGR